MVKTDEKNTAMAGYKGLHKKQATNWHNKVEEQNLLKDASHSLEKIKMLINRQEQMHNCGFPLVTFNCRKKSMHMLGRNYWKL